LTIAFISGSSGIDGASGMITAEKELAGAFAESFLVDPSI